MAVCILPHSLGFAPRARVALRQPLQPRPCTRMLPRVASSTERRVPGEGGGGDPGPGPGPSQEDALAWLQNNVLLGVEPTPEVAAIMTTYFVQGALGLARLATTFYLKDDLGMGPAESGALLGLASLPWVIKPVYGFLSDSVPIFG